MRFFLPTVLFVLFCCVAPARAQQDGLLQINDPIHTFLLRQQTAGNLPEAHLSHQPLSAYEARRYLDSLATRTDALTAVDRALLARYRLEAPGPGAAAINQKVSWLYPNGNDLLAVSGDDFALQFNPLLYLSLGWMRQSAREGREDSYAVWQNTRGLRASGHVGPQIFFELRLEENLRLDPFLGRQNIQQRLGTVKFDRSLGANDKIELDYFLATGLVGFKSKFFEIRLGRDRNRWGFSTNSLLLSNYPTVYDQLQIRTTFWRLQYSVIFSAMIDRFAGRPDNETAYPPKYGSLHRISINVSNRVKLGFFESVIYAPQSFESVGSYLGFFNPLIFYRAVDWDYGSPGNMMLGFDVNWVVLNGLLAYGQFMMDEFDASEFFSNPGHWKNTYGLQFGLHATDIGLRNLDLRAEYGFVRPYTYSNKSTALSYVHQRGILGYPAGPNTADLSVFLSYTPTPRWTAALNFAYTRRGRNTDDQNFGANPSRPYTEDRVDENGDPLDDGVKLLQGVRQKLILLEGRVGYELLPNLFLEGALRYQSLDDAEFGLDRYISPFLLLRWGLPFQSMRY